MKKPSPIKFIPALVSSVVLIFLAFPSLAQDIVPPQCYGGSRLTREFVQEEMIYPSRALETKTEGTVVLSFMVMPDGSVGGLEVLERASPDLDREAIRIFKKILWHPATQMGRPIAYRHEFEVKFKIKKYMNLIKNRGPEYFVNPHEPVDTGYVVYRRKELDQVPKPLFSILDNDFQTFLSNNLEYPEAAFKQNISGTVELRFVVEVSGRVSNIQVEKS